MNKREILLNAEKLIRMYNYGELAGEVMSEDVNPKFYKEFKENYLYFTLSWR